jgi:CheY-like chemotaxis protein
MKNLRSILLAEDNPNDVELIRNTLLKKKFANKIDVVNDGAEVLEFLRCEGKYKSRSNIDPAVVILDLMMPGMNGIEVLREIRRDPVLKFIPIVMLSASNDQADLKICYELGVNAYVVKPLNFDDFADTVTDLGLFWALLNEVPNREVLYNSKG